MDKRERQALVAECRDSGMTAKAWCEVDGQGSCPAGKTGTRYFRSHRDTRENILTKVGIAKRYGLDGIAVWRFSLVTSGVWDVLRATVMLRR